jgi:hypothetical protein
MTKKIMILNRCGHLGIDAQTKKPKIEPMMINMETKKLPGTGPDTTSMPELFQLISEKLNTYAYQYPNISAYGLKLISVDPSGTFDYQCFFMGAAVTYHQGQWQEINGTITVKINGKSI